MHKKECAIKDTVVIPSIISDTVNESGNFLSRKSLISDQIFTEDALAISMNTVL